VTDQLHPSGLRIRKPDLGRSRPACWAWRHRIVLGYVNLLIGNEGIGKGVLASWMFARLSRGELPGDLAGKPAVVGIIADEDSFDGVWTPRLHAAGADFDHIRHIEREDGWAIDLGEDRERLKLAADLERVRVLFLDALLDNLGVGVDDWRSKQVRHALQPLRTISREFDIAVVGSMHPNKRGETFRQLVSGAGAFNQVSRSSLLLAEHPDDEARRVLARGKGNLSGSPAAVEFDIDSYQFEANGYRFDVPKAVNFTESDLAVDDLIRAAAPPPPAGEARTAARDLIAAALADGDWHPAAPIITECAEHEVHERAARRAARDIGIEHERRGFPAASWWRIVQSGHQSGHTPASAHAVRSGRTVRTENVAQIGSPDSADTPSNSEDRQDRQDNTHTSRTAVRTGDEALPQGWTLDQLEAIAAEQRETV
jgi:AAA domain